MCSSAIMGTGVEDDKARTSNLSIRKAAMRPQENRKRSNSLGMLLYEYTFQLNCYLLPRASYKERLQDRLTLLLVVK